MTLSIHLLGPFLARGGQEQSIHLTSKKAKALLAYLSVEGARPHYRDALAGLLWPDHPDRAARGSLRQALQDLRHAIGDAVPQPLFLASREAIQLDPRADLWLDVAAFEGLVASTARQPLAGPEAEAALRSAIALYRGPFLDGLSLGDSPAFEEWLLLRREQLGRQVLLALNALAALYEARAAFADALACARRAIELEPWHEEARRRVMRLLALSGQRSAAIEQFRSYEQLVRRELAVRPDPETLALYERICRGEVVAPSPARAEEAALAPAPLVERVAVPALVGRESELAKLAGWLAQALAGEGRVALVTGEAGSGKTALVEEFGRQAMAAEEGLLVALGCCSARGGVGDAYQPFRDILRMLTGEAEGVLGAAHARRLRGSLCLTFEALARQGPDLARLLATDPQLVARARACAAPGAAWIGELESTLGKADAPGALIALQPPALCEQVARVLHALARQQPVLVLLDDLQWADAPSLDLLFYLGRRLQGHRILIVGTWRTGEADPPSPGGPHPLAAIANEFQRQWGDMRLDLAQSEGRRFVDAYIDRWPNRLGDGFRETLYRHTGGNALFTVELVRAMQERGDLLRDRQGRWAEGPSLAWAQLPPRVEGAISQRIGQLSAEQVKLLEAASVEGDEFHAEVLARALGLSTEAVAATLSGPLGRQAHIVMPGSLVRVGERQLARYRFRHGMFQSHLYGGLDAVARARLHGAIGEAAEALFGQDGSRQAGQLARHFEEGGRLDKAAAYLLRAGQRAGWVGAHREAIGCYERGLALLGRLPPTAERSELEFALQMAMDYSLVGTQGWGASERLRVLGRAQELGRQVGWPTPVMLGALRGLADLAAARGEYQRAISLANELLAAGEQAGDRLSVASAHAILSHCLAMQGELAPAWEHVSQATAFGRQLPRRLSAQESLGLRPRCDIAECLLLLSLGKLDQARGQMARLLASDDWDAGQRTIILCLAAMLHALLHEDREARRLAEEGLRTIGGEPLPEMRAWAEGVLGWAEARSGQPREGVAHLASSIRSNQERNTLTFRYLFLSLLAEAYLAGGELGLAAQTVEQALSDMAETGTHYHEAEMWRLRGEIALRERAAAPEPERCFTRAVEIARKQGARWLELRATVSLARLWARAGRLPEARAALGACYATFVEGFDAPDLVEARALLAALAEP